MALGYLQKEVGEVDSLPVSSYIGMNKYVGDRPESVGEVKEGVKRF